MGQKILHKGAIFKGLNSTITIPCGIFGVRLSQKGNNFVLIEVITAGVDNPIKYNITARPKVVKNIIKEEKKEEIQSVSKDIGQETLC